VNCHVIFPTIDSDPKAVGKVVMQSRGPVRGRGLVKATHKGLFFTLPARHWLGAGEAAHSAPLAALPNMQSRL